MPKEDAISAIKREYVHEFLDICDSNSLNVSYTEAINAVNQLPKVNRDHFAKGNYVYAGTKPTDGNPDHEIHILKGNNIMQQARRSLLQEYCRKALKP